MPLNKLTLNFYSYFQAKPQSIPRFITEEAIGNSATKRCSGLFILIVLRVGVGKVAYSEKSLCRV
ncbi:MAG TPA: hypothetical protein VF985_09145, partial [Mariniflexile sp.]